MNQTEKALLKEVIQSSNGMIPFLGGGQGGIMNRLITKGFVEPFHYKNMLSCRATENGRLVFEPFWKRVWVFFTNNIATIFSIIATFIALLALLKKGKQ